MIAWGLPELLSKWPQLKNALGLSMVIVLTTLGICAHQQVSYWSNSTALFSHAIEVTQNNDVAHNSRGVAYVKLGRSQEAIEDFSQAIRIKPNHVDAHNNLAWILATSPDPNIRNPSLAISLAQEACNATNFENPAVLDTLGAAYASKGRFADAVETANTAVKLANAANQPQIKNTIERHLIFYKQNKPYVESVKEVIYDINKP